MSPTIAIGLYESPFYSRLCSGFKFIAILIAAVLASGCIGGKSRPVGEVQPAAPAVAPAVVPETPDADIDEYVDEEDDPQPLTIWVVIKGDNLWNISGDEDVYNMPEKWPLLYKSNIDEIDDADLIHPGQVLIVPRGSSEREIDAAINHARNRGAWVVGAPEISDQQYLQDSTP